jgi:hypothetical protein
MLWSIWNIQIYILCVSTPTYLYNFLNIGANVLIIIEYRLIECLFLNANDDDDVHFVLDQQAELELHSPRSLK